MSSAEAREANHTTPAPETNAVHNLEHAYVLVYYRADGQDALPGGVADALTSFVNSQEKAIMAPFARAPQPRTASDGVRRCCSSTRSGLGIPFLLPARGYASGGRPFAWLRRHGGAVAVAGGRVLLLMGVLMITGAWIRLFTPILRLFSRTGWPPV